MVTAHQSVERALRLLSSFDDAHGELSVSELARAAGIHKSTASRLAAVLERRGYLRRLLAELAEARDRGYATARSELEEGLVAVAAPVLDGSGRCVAALSVSGPELRLSPTAVDRIGRLCASP